ncbi:MAG: O-methyltransferase [Nitrososphaerales archaeon]
MAFAAGQAKSLKPSRPIRIEKTAPDVLWVTKLARTTVSEGSKYISEAIEDSELGAHLARAFLSGGRSNYVQIGAPYELYALARLVKPEHIVEIGVSAGLSSAYFLRALERNQHGKLHSIDLPEKQVGSEFSGRKQACWALPPGKSSGWAVPEGLGRNWDLRLGRSGDLLPALIGELGSVDIFLYDVPYTFKSAVADFQTVDSKLRAGSIVLADNALKPITSWAKLRRRKPMRRKGLGLQGFSVS